MNNTKQGGYACMAATAEETALGGRCRLPAKTVNGYCLDAHEPGDSVAEPSKVIAFMLWLSNHHLHEEAAKLDFPIGDRSIVETQERHEIESAFLKRSFKAYRPAGDTGCNVFGKKALEHVIRLDKLMDELERNGFERDGTVHGENAIDGGKAGVRLVVRMRHKGIDSLACPRQPRLNTRVHDDFVEKLLRKKMWMKVNIFDNPRKYWVYNGQRPLQFQILEYPASGAGIDRPIGVQLLYPVREVMEMDPELFSRAIRFPISTINCRIPLSYGGWTQEMVQIGYKNGSWSLRYVLPRRAA